MCSLGQLVGPGKERYGPHGCGRREGVGVALGGASGRTMAGALRGDWQVGRGGNSKEEAKAPAGGWDIPVSLRKELLSGITWSLYSCGQKNRS